MSEPTPGWFPDPNDPRIQRYWTGTQWGDRRMWNGTEWAPSPPIPAPDAVPPPTPHNWSPQPPVYAPTGPASPMDKRIVMILVSAAVTILGCLLPWATQDTGFTSTSINGTSAGGGQLLIVLGLVVGTLAFLALRAMAGRKALVAVLLLGLLGVVIVAANLANVGDVISQEQAAGLPDGVGTNAGIGLLVALAGTIMIAVTAILALRTSRRPR